MSDAQVFDNKNEMTPRVAALWFWSVVGFFTVLWVLLPALAQPGYRPDVVELQFIGREWVLSTRKHPMLPAWILEILNLLTGRAFAAPFIAAQLCTLVSLWSVWSLGRRVLSERLALVGGFMMLPYWYFTVESIKYNQNIVLIACWSLSVYLVFRAFQTDRLVYWIASGLSLGLAFHAKYTAIFLVVSILLYMAIRPEARRYWKRIGPYLTTGIALAVFLPHLIWLRRNDFVTLQYARDNSGTGNDWTDHFSMPPVFAISCLIILLLPLFCLLPTLPLPWKRAVPERQAPAREAERFLFYCIAVPFFLHLLAALLTGAKLNVDYGAAFWPFLGLYLLLRCRAVDTPESFRKTLACVCAAEALLVAGMVVQSVFSPYLLGDARRFHFPFRELAAQCDAIWDERYRVPCPYVSGEWFCAGNAAIAMRDRPHVLFYWEDLDNAKTLPSGTWATEADLNNRGGLILWPIYWETEKGIPPEMPEILRKRFPGAETLPDVLVLPYKTGAKIPPLRIAVAIVPPPL